MEKFKIRTFGRIKNRKLGDIKLKKMENFFPKFKIEIDNNNLINFPNNNQKLFFEIGFGYGEHTAHQALLNKDYNIVGCETYINGVLSLLDKIEIEEIENIRIFNGDARLLLEKLPNNSIDKIFILFPDPWPKNRQNKKRIISEEFVQLIQSKLKKDGILFFASDILDYIKWTCNFTKGKFKPLFTNLEECKKEPDWWVRTKYQQKAIKEGRESYFLEFIVN
ncbi:MAG: tRNA (guanosine(46)-N7)-methyltransferase TrmB [Rickettsiales bacterium]|nr:tRNA (guanosine(46)-N7)-methyltransferase TrmB [Rickettsiales bacterium]